MASMNLKFLLKRLLQNNDLIEFFFISVRLPRPLLKTATMALHRFIGLLNAFGIV